MQKMRQNRTFPTNVPDKKREGSYKHNFLGSVTKGQKEEPWCVSLQIGASSVSFKVDSGADVTTLDDKTCKSMANPPDMRPTSDTLAGAGGKITCYGKFRQRQRDQRIESMSSMSTSLTVAAYWVEQTHLHWALASSTEIRELSQS